LRPGCCAKELDPVGAVENGLNRLSLGRKEQEFLSGAESKCLPMPAQLRTRVPRPCLALRSRTEEEESHAQG